jgi:hypothetical protein
LTSLEEGVAFQAIDGLASASGLFFVAAGLSLIFGVTHIINIAHGSLYMLGTYIAVTLVTAIGGPLGFWKAFGRRCLFRSICERLRAGRTRTSSSPPAHHTPTSRFIGKRRRRSAEHFICRNLPRPVPRPGALRQLFALCILVPDRGGAPSFLRLRREVLGHRWQRAKVRALARK